MASVRACVCRCVRLCVWVRMSCAVPLLLLLLPLRLPSSSCSFFFFLLFLPSSSSFFFLLLLVLLLVSVGGDGVLYSYSRARAEE